MTVPRERVAFGAHVFPFAGLHAEGVDRPGLPLLPIRLRRRGGTWMRPMNAILDTGSNRTVLPAGVDELTGAAPGSDRRRLGGLGKGAETVDLGVDLAIVDANYPGISCWEFANVAARMVLSEDDLDHPVVGWDVLGWFDMTISAEDSRIELRPTKGLVGDRVAHKN